MWTACSPDGRFLRSRAIDTPPADPGESVAVPTDWPCASWSVTVVDVFCATSDPFTAATSPRAKISVTTYLFILSLQLRPGSPGGCGPRASPVGTVRRAIASEPRSSLAWLVRWATLRNGLPFSAHEKSHASASTKVPPNSPIVRAAHRASPVCESGHL